MRQENTVLQIKTFSEGLYEFTDQIQGWLRQSGIMSGLLTVYCRHSSASLTIQENADPDVVLDLNDFFADMAPQDPKRYRHTSEGPDDMPAHIKSALTDVSLSIPVLDGRAVLGTWQGVYLFEHRHASHTRQVVLQVMGV